MVLSFYNKIILYYFQDGCFTVCLFDSFTDSSWRRQLTRFVGLIGLRIQLHSVGSLRSMGFLFDKVVS